jgi:hypothetical protein
LAVNALGLGVLSTLISKATDPAVLKPGVLCLAASHTAATLVQLAAVPFGQANVAGLAIEVVFTGTFLFFARRLLTAAAVPPRSEEAAKPGVSAAARQ